MNPLNYKKLTFLCIGNSPKVISEFILDEFRKPSEWDPPDMEAHYFIEKGKFSYANAYVDIPAAGYSPLNAILWEPKNALGKTVLMTSDGDCLSFAAEMFAPETDFEWIHILIADHPSRTYPGVHFWYFKGQSSRCIDCIVEEKGWVFGTTGKPLEFEDVRAYKNRDKSKRLTREMVIDYLSHLGYEIDVPEFWTPKQSYRIWQVNRKK